MQAHGYAVSAAKATFEPITYDQREVGPTDVAIAIRYCGVCHSDVHQARDEWGGGIFPMVPGHEIVGEVESVGAEVKDFKPGDRVGVGCMVGSCGECESCRDGEEQFCLRGTVFTYNTKLPDGTVTKGGYADRIVVDRAFVLRVPESIDFAAAAPLLCAGITTYSPMRHWNVEAGKKVGVVGLGGLGHMALQFAHALGARVVQFTTSKAKREDALRLGADEVVDSSDETAMKAHENSFDFIIDTVSAPHDLEAYLTLLRRNGTMTLIGVPDKAPTVDASSLIFKRASLAGSLIGGIAQTQEMLDFCGERGIAAEIETIPIQKLDEAFDRMVRSDVRYRFVIDMASVKPEAGKPAA